MISQEDFEVNWATTVLAGSFACFGCGRDLGKSHEEQDWKINCATCEKKYKKESTHRAICERLIANRKRVFPEAWGIVPFDGACSRCGASSE